MTRRARHRTRFLVALQWPINDLRQLSIVGSHRLPAPSWPDPRSGDEFIRGVGVVKDRPRGPIRYWEGEKSYCNAGRLVQMDGSLPMGKGWAASVIYRRVYGTALSYRLDFGVLISGPTSEEDSFREHLPGILRWPVSIDGGRWELGWCGRGIADALFERTSPHGSGYANQRRWLTAGVPALLIESRGFPPFVGFVRAHRYMHRGRALGLYEIGDDRTDSARVRQIRGALWRLHAELEVLKEIGRRWRAQPELLNPRFLRDYLNSACGALGREVRGGARQPPLLALAESVEGFESRVDLAWLADELREESLGIARKLDLMLERSERFAMTPAPKHIHIGNLSMTLEIRDIVAKNRVDIKTVKAANFVVGSRNTVTANTVVVQSVEQEWLRLLQLIDATAAGLEPQQAQIVTQTRAELQEVSTPSERRSRLGQLGETLKDLGSVATPILELARRILEMMGG